MIRILRNILFFTLHRKQLEIQYTIQFQHTAETVT
jgi:hypothetical protein